MRKLFLLLVSFALTLSACSAAPTIIVEPTSPRLTSRLPQTEADVPRVTVGEAKAALQSGIALVVDVRSAQSFAAGHIEGAVNIPLTQIEADPAALPLDKNLWVITYCT